MLTFSASKNTKTSVEEVFRRINTIEKVLRYETEFKTVEIETPRKKSGVATVRVKIFGKNIAGKMSYRIERRRITAIVHSEDIQYLRFGYVVKKQESGSTITQFVEFDTGSLLKNLFVRLFYSFKIRRHLEKEIEKIVDDINR